MGRVRGGAAEGRGLGLRRRSNRRDLGAGEARRRPFGSGSGVYASACVVFAAAISYTKLSQDFVSWNLLFTPFNDFRIEFQNLCTFLIFTFFKK